MTCVSRPLILAALLVAAMVGASADKACNNGCTFCNDGVCQECAEGFFLYSKGGFCIKRRTKNCVARNSNNVCIVCEAPYTIRTWDNLANGQPSSSECNGGSSVLSISATVAAAVVALLYTVAA